MASSSSSSSLSLLSSYPKSVLPSPSPVPPPGFVPDPKLKEDIKKIRAVLDEAERGGSIQCCFVKQLIDIISKMNVIEA